jgi:amidohydrolase
MNQLIAWRRDFHRHPELAFQEHRTSAVIRAYLESLGLDVRACGGTGLRAVLAGQKPGRTVALRADMDALPIAEENDVEYRSTSDGVMHACGHDGHMAILMDTARELAARRETLPGRVVFLFQPAEETPPGGAEQMLADGALDGVDTIFGLHLWQPLPTGVVGIRAGAMMAQSDSIRVVVTGRGGHASQPHLAADPILAASHLVVAAQSIASRTVDPVQPVVVSFTTIHGGRTHNVIPDAIELTGTVRTIDPGVQRQVKSRLGEICEQTGRLFGGTAALEYVDGYPPLVNDPAVVEVVARVAREALGDALVREIPPVMGGEDFARYLQAVPGAFAMLGMGDGRPFPHHNARFDIDEAALPIGVRLMVGMAERLAQSS